MPVRRSRQGSNSFAAKLITRANSAKINHHTGVTSSNNNNNNQSSTSTINGGSGSDFATNLNSHTNGTDVKHSGGYTNHGSGNIILTAKQQHQLQRNAYLSTLNKDQLKLECRKRGQKTSGTKLDLVYMHFYIKKK